jgi:predicted AAA+ superfamily ATPase
MYHQERPYNFLDEIQNVDDITINVVPVWKWLCATD